MKFAYAESIWGEYIRLLELRTRELLKLSCAVSLFRFYHLPLITCYDDMN